MDLKDAYLEVAERSLKSAESALSVDIHETGTFLSYHAFESIGGALCASAKEPYPRGHRKKINAFVSVSSRGALRKAIGYDVAMVAILVSSLRNQCLYPHMDAGGTVTAPSVTLTKRTHKVYCVMSAA